MRLTPPPSIPLPTNQTTNHNPPPTHSTTKQAMLAAGEWFLALPAPLAAWIASASPTTPTPTPTTAAAGAAAAAAAASSPLARWLAGRLATAAAASTTHTTDDHNEEEEGGQAAAAAERALDPLFALCQATPRLEQALALAGKGLGGGMNGWMVDG